LDEKWGKEVWPFKKPSEKFEKTQEKEKEKKPAALKYERNFVTRGSQPQVRGTRSADLGGS